MMRRIGCGLALALIWLLILGWAAQVPWSAPLQPAQRQVLNARDFRVVIGGGAEDGESLHVGAVGDDGSALQTMPLHVRAEDVATLRYRFEGFPRTLELSFVFRSSDAPDDVQAVTVPWPGDDWRSVDLTRLPAWHGDITELGFAEYATPQVAPESTAFRPFRFDRAELWSPSWRGSIAALYTSWFGYTPWALLSVSALGPQREVAQPAPLLPFAVLGCVLSLLAAALILRWSRSRSAIAALVCAIALWAALDMNWLDDFRGKHALTEAIYADKAWNEREQLLPDQDIAAAAAQVRAYFATREAPHRMLVAADSKYMFLKLIYLLLPLNAAPLQEAVLPQWPARDTFVLLYRDSRWHYDEARGTLLDANGMRPALPAGNIFHAEFDGKGRLDPVLATDDLQLFAYHAQAPQ